MESLQEIFNKVCEYCIENRQFTQIAYETWLKEATLYSIENNYSTAVIHAKSEFSQNVIETKLKDKLAVGFENTLGFPVDIKVVCEKNTKNPASPEGMKKSSSDPSPSLQPQHEGEGDYDFTFATFIVGPSNKFAHAASMAVASNPAKAYNPLFIYGGVGLGKTHLMHAIGHYAHELYPDMRILYITSEDFTNQLVSAMQTNQNQQFRERFRNVDILMVDDIQFIAGKHGTEEEFFHTFNHLREAGKQIVMTSDKPPKEIQKLEERLCSRFEGGLVADIQRPDFETRLAILRKKAEFEHLNISDDILALIAEKIDTNVRELEGSVTRLTAYSSLTRRPIDMQLAREALRELFKHSETRVITCDSIQDAVANYYGLSVEDLKSPKRNHEITVPRQIAMYLAREMMGLSLTRIGDAFGGRHYTTVMSSISKVEDSIKQSPSLVSLLDDIRRMIKNPT